MARLKYWVDIAGDDTVEDYDAESAGLVSYRMYVTAFDDKDVPGQVQTYLGGYKYGGGAWLKTFDAEVEVFTTYVSAWDSGDREMIRRVLSKRSTWVVNTNVPRQLDLFVGDLDGYTVDEIADWSLTPLYGPSNPLPVVVTGWQKSLDKPKGSESLTITFEPRDPFYIPS